LKSFFSRDIFFIFLIIFFGINIPRILPARISPAGNTDGINQEISGTIPEANENALEKLQMGVAFLTGALFFDNGDLRKLDSSDNTSLELTDDRKAFAYTLIFGHFLFSFQEHVRLHADIFSIGAWGNDFYSGTYPDATSGSKRAENTSFYFHELNLEYSLWHTDTRQFTITLGRQFFSIGGMQEDFIFKDILDAVVLAYQSTYFGRLRFLVLDWYGAANDLSDENYFAYLKPREESLPYFNGDVHTLRSGFVYQTPSVLGLTTRFYGFIARFGATSLGGADRTENGNSGNYADNDYAYLLGIRPVFNQLIGGIPFTLAMDMAFSGGLDRKKDESMDRKIQGLAMGSHISARPVRNLYLNFLLFYAQGSAYDAQGNLLSYGFVSFKGDHLGFFLLDQIYGYHPSSYVSNAGIVAEPFESERGAGTLLIAASIRLKFLSKMEVTLHYMSLTDTGKWQKPYDAKSQDKFNRLGREMGREMGAKLGIQAGKRLLFSLSGAVFLPGPFFQRDSYKALEPAGQDPFWGVNLAATFYFGIPDGEYIHEKARYGFF
jgi:hypothetical protein